MPEGSFYAFPNITKFGLSSKDFALMLLEKTQVVVVPGSAFGEGGEGYLRVSFCGSIEGIKEALSRLQNLLR
jgi:aminotransferase